MTRPHPSDFGRVLREIRREQHLDQLTVALAAGAGSGAYVSRLERGLARRPSVAYVARLVSAYEELGCPLSERQLAALRDALLGPLARRPAA